jgi:flagellar operon protein
MTDPIRTNGVQNTQPVIGNQPQRSQQSGAVQGSSFADMLSDAAKRIKFSNHAQKRMESREIAMDSTGLDRLASAVDKAEAHGSRESLILMDNLAFIVNVPDRTVVTTVNVNNRRSQGVFTQIDSVVIAESDKTLGSA